MSYRFICDHCGKKFELETSEAKECPFCFWSSSVHREEEKAAEKKGGSRPVQAAAARPDRKISTGNLKFLFRTLLIIVLLLVAGFLGYKAYKLFTASSPQTWKVLSIKPSRENKRPVKEVSDPWTLLSPQEKATLSQEVTIPADRAPDPDEQAILGRTVPFQTGWSEKLPSSVWTLGQYQKMITDQEAFYRMPFARSYKKKLEELFSAKYLAAAAAFEKGDILAARNLWVESLTFPLYSTDLKKNRAVALTMLRPFINDTLSKISAMNQSIIDQGKKSKEQALGAEYQKLLGLTAQKKWPEALALTLQMTAEVEQLRKNAVPQAVPPSYPPAFGTIDVDIQRALMDLMSPAPTSTADLQPLQQDLVEKKEVIETFTEAYLKKVLTDYQAALGLIREKKWQEAAQALGALQGPPALLQDAAAKVAVLGKLSSGALDSSQKTG